MGRCLSYTRNHRAKQTTGRWRIFSLSGPLDFFAFNILVPTRKTDGENWYIVLIMDHYSKLANAALTERSTARRFTNIFMLYYTPSFDVPSTDIEDNGPHFTFTAFTELCKEHGDRTVMNIQYQRPVHRHVDCFNATMNSRFRHCVAEQQKN